MPIFSLALVSKNIKLFSSANNFAFSKETYLLSEGRSHLFPAMPITNFSLLARFSNSSNHVFKFLKDSKSEIS